VRSASATAGARIPHPATDLWYLNNLADPPDGWYNEASSVTGSTTANVWSDISGNGYNLLATFITEEPAINPAGLDGKRTIQFDGVDDYMRMSGPDFRNTGAGWAVAVVRKLAVDGSPTVRTLYFYVQGGVVATRIALNLGATAANQLQAQARRLDADSVGVLAGSTLDTSFHIVLQLMDWTNGDGSLVVDGGTPVSNTSMTTDGLTSNTAPFVQASVGSGVSNVTGLGTNFCDVEIAELACGMGTLPSDTEIDKIFGSLAWKWGLESLLPSDHPYKFFPPRL
jgi:hypothetical protein